MACAPIIPELTETPRGRLPKIVDFGLPFCSEVPKPHIAADDVSPLPRDSDINCVSVQPLSCFATLQPHPQRRNSPFKRFTVPIAQTSPRFVCALAKLE